MRRRNKRRREEVVLEEHDSSALASYSVTFLSVTCPISDPSSSTGRETPGHKPKREHVKRLDSVFRLGPRAFEHLLITIREGAPHKQAKAIFPRDHAGLSRTLPCCAKTKHQNHPILGIC